TNAVTWLAGGGLSVDASTLIASTGAATKVINAAQASNELTVEAWVKPANITQTGPARIVTLSTDTALRNFTVGQVTDYFQARLRTTTTTLNGLPAVDTPGGTVSTNLLHLVYARDASGTIRIYVDNVEVVSGSVDGNFSNWDANYRLGLANELTEGRPWLGELHLTAVYGRALTAAEVEQNFNAGVDGSSLPPTATPTDAPLPTGTPTNTPPPTATPTNAPPATATNTPPPTGSDVIYVSSTTGGSVDGVAFVDEDILAYDTGTGTWSLYFDGSDVGLGADPNKDVD
ncbi:MAG: LamG domain-containing protein, partial [Chloroflexi bacterium]|nr:LamG domain-containing protein [Chloroflexota bacterium]